MTHLFMETVNRIEAELSQEYWGGAINWIDKNYSNAWSNALERFEAAINQAASSSNRVFFASECGIYKTHIVEFMRIYKNHLKIDSKKDLINQIRNKK